MKVSSILQAKGDRVATIGGEATVAEALDRLKNEGVGALVISGDGRTVEGILSERDIVRGLVGRAENFFDLPVSGLMTVKVQTCRPEDDTQDLMATMTEMRIRHLPVVDDAGLCGIISIGDVVKARLGELESEANALREYIAG